MIQGYLALLFALTVFAFRGIGGSNNGEVLGASTISTNDVAQSISSIKTKTAFSVKEVDEKEIIPFEIKYEADKDMEYGEEKILEAGENGLKTTTYKITHWFDELISKDKIDVKITPAKTQITAKGTKIVWKIYATPDVGRIKYWRKMRVWATKYDGNCEGCRGLTFSGTRVVKGVCATDPKVIKLGTNFYVDGYGLCRAEDIGGAIKGNKIDLGFEDAAKGAWGAAYTDIYLLTSAPENSQ